VRSTRIGKDLPVDILFGPDKDDFYSDGRHPTPSVSIFILPGRTLPHSSIDRSFNPDGEIIPGRPFNPEAATEESRALIDLLEKLQSDHNILRWTCHIDLHETTDTDESEFRPAKAARDGDTGSKSAHIPDGFYLVSDSTRTQHDWNAAMIDAVRKVTHIAPPDADGTIIGEEVVQEGVIAIPSPRSLGLCAGVTDAEFATTTEVYPDSPRATGAICNRAQIACIEAALTFILDSA